MRPAFFYAWLRLDGLAGPSKQAVQIIDETPEGYRIRSACEGPVRLAGFSRYMEPDQTAVVPKHAVRPRELGTSCEWCGRVGLLGPFRAEDGRTWAKLCKRCRRTITTKLERKRAPTDGEST